MESEARSRRPRTPDVTEELAQIAKFAGAVDFAREVDCPECGSLVKVRPGEAVEVGDDDIVEREIPVVGEDGTRTLRRVRLTVADWRDLTSV